MNLNGYNLFIRAAMNSFHQAQDFKPIYGVNFVIRPESSSGSRDSGDNLLELEVEYQAEAGLEYYLILVRVVLMTGLAMILLLVLVNFMGWSRGLREWLILRGKVIF